MKTVFLLSGFLLFASISGYSQESKFKFGISISPMYSWGLITNDGNSPQWLEDQYKESEIGKISWSSSFVVEYAIHSKIQLGIGIGYQNNGQRTEKRALFFFDDPTNPSGNPNFPIESRFVYNHHNVEIPFFIRYSFLPKFYLSAGLSPTINILNTSTSVLYYREGEGETERNTNEDSSTDFRRLNLCANFGIGVIVYKTEKMEAFVKAQGYYGVFGVSSNASLNRTPVAAGLTFGVRF